MLGQLIGTYTHATAHLQDGDQALPRNELFDAERRTLSAPMKHAESELARLRQLLAEPLGPVPLHLPHRPQSASPLSPGSQQQSRLGMLSDARPMIPSAIHGRMQPLQGLSTPSSPGALQNQNHPT